ncbi:IS630 family transposase [Methylobacterium sp. WL18]|uniref:IS630 family transposase n=1 Tax=Methylobacterium sp. WL18 TaxID=2603897 RepID=UPI0011C82B6C|nr:IS630 family transposase [Methylobacterium sp. WL18]TXN75914.1 IS630 family transposase [Methylobacterium sp. WL18]
MIAPVLLRSDFDADGLRTLAICAHDPAQTRHLLALSAIYVDGSRSAAAVLGGVGLRAVRDWVVVFNAYGPDGLIGGKAPGARPLLNVKQRETLRALIEQGPMPAAHGVVRWRLVDLAQILFEDHGVSVSEQTLSRVLRAMGYRKLSARPRHHAQDPDAILAFKKPFPARMAEIAQAVGGKPIEIWFADEARVGQKNTITRRWAKRGTRPAAPKDQCTASAYISHPEPVEGRCDLPRPRQTAALVMPRCTTEAMALYLEEIAQVVAPGAHAVLLLDQAGWHTHKKFVVAANFTVLPLPARFPELNPVGNLWQFMRDNWLGNCVVKSYIDNLDHCCHALNTLIDRPSRIISIGMRARAHGS